MVPVHMQIELTQRAVPQNGETTYVRNVHVRMYVHTFSGTMDSSESVTPTRPRTNV